MTNKVLVADDSATIQKVVGITLSSGDYNLQTCLSEKELFAKLESDENYDLIVMDFNLSNQRSGLQMAEEISRLSPSIPIMAMLGTFDEVDEDELKAVGIGEKIVKPFDATEFVKKCSQLLQSDGEIDENDQWNMNPVEESQEEIQEEGPALETNDLDKEFVGEFSNELQKEINDWGVNVPEVIGEENISVELPPAMEGEKTSDVLTDSPRIPSEEPEEFENRETLEELLHLNAEDFWSVDEKDEFSVADPPKKLQKESQVESQVEPVEPQIDSPQKPPLNVESFDEDQLVLKMKKALVPAIEEMVKKYCSQKVEQVAWEVIPDLAENLIRSEIREVSERHFNGT